MIYKERIKQLLEALDIKIEVIEKFNNGTMNISRTDAAKILVEIKQLSERITNLVENER
jgi:cellobiose-specific phosphotransferase system component IIB